MLEGDNMHQENNKEMKHLLGSKREDIRVFTVEVGRDGDNTSLQKRVWDH